MEEPPKSEQTSEQASAVHPKVLGRAKFLFCVAILLFAALLVRILLLQTVGYSRYQKKVIDQMTTQSEVTAVRGNIYDRNGVLLATNITTYRIFISPSSIAKAQSNLEQSESTIRLDRLIAENLSEMLDVSYDFVLKQTTYTGYLDRTIKKEVDEASADRVRAFIDEYGLEQLIYLQTTSTRYYPYGSLGAHVIGFTGSDGTGLYGLEYYYNELLSGTNGRYITARDAQGNEMPFSYKEYIEAEDGYHLTTTLDIFVQSALEESLEEAYLESGGQNRAAGIVMDVNTGEVLAMAVYPSFDLNDPWSLDSFSMEKLEQSAYLAGSEEYAALKQQLLLEMWSNKAITESYIPGSTFKVLTASMAVEEDVVELDESYCCVGSYTVLGQKIHCHKTNGHGTLSFVQGIQQSCNPWLMRVGLRLGRGTFCDYLKAYGYREKTGIDLPGEGREYIAAEADFTDLDLAIYAFGQNFNVTLMQHITAISSVANGGYLLQPHLLSTVKDNDGNVLKSVGTQVKRQVVSSSTCQTVSDILEKGVSGDGGAKNAYVAGYRVAAKTGTSEKKNAGSEGKYVCSTVAYAPADDPQYAAIIIVDEPTKGSLYGSTVAAPYVGDVMETILPYLGVEAVYTEEELAKLAVTVPNCTYWQASTAKEFMEKSPYGLKVEIIGDADGVVYKQYPEGGTVVEKASGTVYLYTNQVAQADTVVVPDVLGMTAVAANGTLINAGLNIRIEGTKNYLSGKGAVVVSQSVQAGQRVERGTVITVVFRYLDDMD